MGRFIGSFMDDNELDRPDLNKCPDCECYFPQDCCPICGKECPEEMRAGNRKRQKHKKSRNGRSKHKVFLEWYHRWWFILLMMFFMPIIGILLIIGSPRSKGVKTVALILALIYAIGSFYGFGQIAGSIKAAFEKPVDTSLSYEEYVGKCEEVSAEAIFRDPEEYKGKFVKLEVTVSKAVTDSEGYYEKRKYNDYYLCYFEDGDGRVYELLVRECIQDGQRIFAKGDIITVYGEGAGERELYGMDGEYIKKSCVNAAYADVKASNAE